ncbi:Gfo/Idh/MocA family protein [Microbacterium sp. MEC084]|uniref:Gfo/Idh/MocA family protein n=1 Tax=Microbacterium sp. MEC084 TaxID=1963027 RepID=UPI001E5AF1D6|nr:Gfo/Idh/MocA family oxidoreductase [Microbacterium sp. MEC084]
MRVALIGYSFMGRIHAQAWQTAARFFDVDARVDLAVGRDAAALGDFARRFGIRRTTTDWRSAVDDPEIDAVDICVPGDLHAEITLAALAAGKHVLCEKPLANSVPDAERMTDAAVEARSRGVRSMVGFSYRGTPALGAMKALIDDGRLGTIRHVRATYLQDWITDEQFPLVWRLQREKAGSGALGDIGAHVIDMAVFLTGQRLTGVSALTETFVKERPLPAASGALAATAGTGTGTVDVDDAAVFIGRTDGGALATFEATRFAAGRKNAIRIEVNGSRGSVAFDFERMNEFEFHDHTLPGAEAGFRRVLATEPDHPFVDAWWPAGHGLGYEHTFTHEVVTFARAVAQGSDPLPSFEDGLYVQRVLEAVERSAAGGAGWRPVGS